MVAENKRAHEAAIALLICMVFCFVLFICVKMPLWLNLAIVVPCILATLVQWFITGRKILFTKDGCEVSFFGFRKFYAWDDLKLKQKENYDNQLGNIWGKGAFFSTKDVNRNPRLSPVLFSFFHPFSSFFVCFKHETFTLRGRTNAIAPHIDETEFLEKMVEWGIVLTTL